MDKFVAALQDRFTALEKRIEELETAEYGRIMYVYPYSYLDSSVSISGGSPYLSADIRTTRSEVPNYARGILVSIQITNIVSGPGALRIYSSDSLPNAYGQVIYSTAGLAPFAVPALIPLGSDGKFQITATVATFTCAFNLFGYWT